MPPLRLSASLACADWLHLEHDVRAIEEAGVAMLHMDVMDGLFVPNFALNLDVMRAVRQVSALPVEAHLMIEAPERYLARFVEAGADYLIIHQEATRHLQRALAEIRALGVHPGVALNPATPLNVLDYVLADIDLLLIMTVNPGFAGQTFVPAMLRKIAEAHTMIQERGLEIAIEVDGNVSFETAPQMVRSGATILVGGTSSLFWPGRSIQENAEHLRRVLRAEGCSAEDFEEAQ